MYYIGESHLHIGESNRSITKMPQLEVREPYAVEAEVEKAAIRR
jgi:hypothetical protein